MLCVRELWTVCNNAYLSKVKLLLMLLKQMENDTVWIGFVIYSKHHMKVFREILKMF